jgi:hypothetical protein
LHYRQERSLNKLQTIARIELAANMSKREKRRFATEMVEAVMSFWGSILDHELGDNEFDSALISGLAVHGVDTEDCAWADVLNFTPKLAAIVTCSKAIVVYMAWSRRERAIKALVEQGAERESAKAEVHDKEDANFDRIWRKTNSHGQDFAYEDIWDGNQVQD